MSSSEDYDWIPKTMAASYVTKFDQGYRLPVPAGRAAAIARTMMSRPSESQNQVWTYNYVAIGPFQSLQMLLRPR
jgi:hypothetical protein